MAKPVKDNVFWLIRQMRDPQLREAYVEKCNEEQAPRISAIKVVFVLFLVVCAAIIVISLTGVLR